MRAPDMFPFGPLFALTIVYSVLKVSAGKFLYSLMKITVECLLVASVANLILFTFFSLLIKQIVLNLNCHFPLFLAYKNHRK